MDLFNYAISLDCDGKRNGQVGCSRKTFFHVAAGSVISASMDIPVVHV
jgi:hypothetical protein